MNLLFVADLDEQEEITHPPVYQIMRKTQSYGTRWTPYNIETSNLEDAKAIIDILKARNWDDYRYAVICIDPVAKVVYKEEAKDA